MTDKVFVNPITGEIMTDEFCGGGGASTGMELATGVPVAVAVNHDPDAILMSGETLTVWATAATATTENGKKVLTDG